MAKEIVVAGKTQDELVGARLDALQKIVQEDAGDAVHGGRLDVWRVAQMGVHGDIALGAVTGHYPAQALGPVTGTKGLAVGGDARDEQLADVVGWIGHGGSVALLRRI